MSPVSVLAVIKPGVNVWVVVAVPICTSTAPPDPSVMLSGADVAPPCWMVMLPTVTVSLLLAGELCVGLPVRSASPMPAVLGR